MADVMITDPSRKSYMAYQTVPFPVTLSNLPRSFTYYKSFHTGFFIIIIIIIYFAIKKLVIIKASKTKHVRTGQQGKTLIAALYRVQK